MTHEKDSPEENAPPEPGASGDISAMHPLSQAMVAYYLCCGPIAEEIDLNKLCEELADAIGADGIKDLNDATLLLSTQTRVLNTIFTRLLMQGFPLEGNANMEFIKAAMQAQRQSASTLDKLKRHTKKT